MIQLTLFMMLGACGGGSDAVGPSTEAAKAVAGRVCNLFGKVGHSECDWKGTTALVAGHEIVVSATIDHDASIGGAVIYTMTYDFSVDGTSMQPFHAPKVMGSARSAKEAFDMGAEDWAIVHGPAFADVILNKGTLGVLQALQDQQQAPPAFVVGEWLAYPGWTKLVGKRTEKRQVDLQLVFNRLQPVIADWKDGKTHTVLIQFNQRTGYAPEKECLLDGQPSEQVCDLVLGYDWPEGAYIMKQAVYFSPGPLPEGIVARRPPPTD